LWSPENFLKYALEEIIIIYYEIVLEIQQENSAMLTNERVSYEFTSSPFSIHVRHILAASKFQHSYSCILLIFYRHQ